MCWDVERRDNVDLCRQEFLDVFVALRVLAAGDIGVCQLIDQNHCGAARKMASTSISSKTVPSYSSFSRNGLHLRDEVFDALRPWLSTTPRLFSFLRINSKRKFPN